MAVINKTVRVWQHAYSAWLHDPLRLMLVSLLDLGFFFALGFATSPFTAGIVNRAFTLSTSINQQLQTGEVLSLTQMLFSETLSRTTWEVIGLMLITLAILYVLYVLIQGYAWYLLRDLVDRVRFTSFYVYFAKINLLWFTLFGIYFAALIMVDLRFTIASTIAQVAKPIIPFIPLYIFLICVVYYAFISYSVSGVKPAHKLAKRGHVALSFVSVLAFLALFQVIVYGVGLANTSAALLLSLLALPLLSLARLVMILVVKT